MVAFSLASVENNDSSNNNYKTKSSLPSSWQINESQAQLRDVWRDIHGAHNWNGLLHPINPTLKAEALRYGDFAQLCYDSFHGETCSKYYGTCKYSKRELFQIMGMSNCGYQVTKYIYANTDVLGSLFGEKSEDKAVWLGFVAVSTDPSEIRRLGRRDIVIAWRGTQTTQEWIQDLRDFLVPARLSYKCQRMSTDRQPVIAPANEGVRIERGFLSCYTGIIRHHENSVGKFANMSARDLVIGEIRRLLTVYENEIHNLSITFTGHSFGAALATLRLAFGKQEEDVGVKVLRLVNQADVVPKVPGVFFNENKGFLSKWLNWLPWTYFHVGVELSLADSSHFFMHANDLAYSHTLDVYLNLLQCYNGGDQESR